MLTLAIDSQDVYSGNILTGCLLWKYTHRILTLAIDSQMLTLAIYSQDAYSGNILTGC